MRVALFGGTGKTGKWLLESLLEDGHTVRLLARTPSKVKLNHERLTVLSGDVLDAAQVEATIAGTHAVLSVFGQVKGSPPDVQTRGTAHIVNAMKRHNLRRVVSLSGGGLPYPEQDRPKLADHLIRGIMRLAVPQVLRDAQGHYEVLAASGLDWTIVRAPRLMDGPRKGTYRVGWVGVNASTQINRADLADFLRLQLTDLTFIHQMPFVSY